MSHNHIRKECQHGFVYAQCRCIAKGKTVEIVDCSIVHDETVPLVTRLTEHKNYEVSGLSRSHMNSIMAGLELYAEHQDSGAFLQELEMLIENFRITTK